MSSNRPLVLLAFAAIYLVWGSTYLAIRYAVETVPPFLMAGSRYLLAGVPMLLFLLWRGAEKPSWVHWRSGLILGAFMMLGGNGLVSWAEQTVPSSIAAVIIATLPLWMTILDRFFFHGPRLRSGTLVGLLLGFGGVALLMAPTSDELGRVNPLGGLALLFAAFLWSVGSLLSRRIELPKSGAMTVTVQMIMGGLALVFVGTLSGEWTKLDLSSISPRSAWSIVYLIVFGSIVTLSAYMWLLRERSASAVSTYAFVNPVVAVILGWFIGGEYLSQRALIAAGFIILAVVIILGPGRLKPKNHEPVAALDPEASCAKTGSAIAPDEIEESRA